jgi:branched-chain amino acid transport system permease protein
LTLPFVLAGHTYYLRIGVLVWIYFVLALGYNAIITTAGLFDLGYTAYFAIGAYASALLLLHTDLSFWLIFPISIAVTVAYVLVASIPILRFKGDYLCIITLAFAEILRLVLNNWLEVTRGPLGLPGIRDPRILSYEFTSITPYYYLAMVMAIAALVLVDRLTYSRIGLRWSAVRENPDAAESVGVNTHRAKVIVYAVGAALAGAAGAVFAPFQGIVDPSLAKLDNTVIVLTMVILGGGSNYGLMAGSAVLTIIPEATRALSTYRLLALGVFFVFIMNVRPGGFRFGVLQHFVLPEWKRRKDGGSGGEGVRINAKEAGELLLRALPISAQSELSREPVLRVQDLSKEFGGLVAVDRVSLELRQGETLGIIGPNGAGKTTLFNMITGTYAPSSGTIFFGDTEITGWKPFEIARRGVARTFQIIKLLPNLTVLDNVMLACLDEDRADERDEGVGRAPKFRLEEAIGRAKAAIAFVGLGGQEALIARNLPFGNRRRLELARALATRPTTLLMDEPASGMNPREVAELIALIGSIKGRGVSILLIEHNMKVAMELSDRIIVLDHGTKIAEGTPYEIQHNEQVIEAYLGKEHQHAAS